MPRACAILVFSGLLALSALADEAPPAPTAAPAATAKKKAAKKQEPPQAPAGAAHMIVTKDVETGEVRPATPEEAARLLGPQPLARSEPVVEVLPDGTRRITLDERHAHWVTVSRNPDGTLIQTCTVAPAAAPAVK